LDSYHAVLAMVAAGAGWSILTPLGWSHAARFRDEVDLHPLPFEPLSRRISLVARRDVLGDMPGDMAARLRGLLSEMIVDPATQKLPWLAGQLRVLG
jgi:DNA-binding transcriptional LysR family regulator